MGVGALLATGATPAQAGPAAATGPTGQVIAFTGYAGPAGERGLMTLDTATGEQRTVATGFTHDAAWSPDGSQLTWIGVDAGTDDLGRVRAAAADGSGVHEVVGEGDSRYLAWTPDGTLASLHRSSWWPTDCSAPDRLTRHDVLLRSADGTTRRLASAAPTARDLQASPDGTTLLWFESGPDVCATGVATLVLADVATGAVRTVAGLPARAGGADVTPDGRTVVLHTDEGTASDLVLVDVATATARRLSTPAAAEQWPAVSPDGTSIAVDRYADGRRTLALLALDGTLRRELGPAPDVVDGLTWSPDGSGLVVAGASTAEDCTPAEPCDHPVTEPALWWQPVDGGASTVLTRDSDAVEPEVAFAPWFPPAPVLGRHARGVRPPAS